MQNLDLKKIINFSDAELQQGSRKIKIKEIVIDSREVKKDYLYIAIIGENKDGHQFLEEAAKNGAAAVIVDRDLKSNYIRNSNIAVLKVKDTTKALQNIAHNYRKTFKKLKLVAVTGSAGKTTTKDLIYSVLSQKYHCLKTKGNYNNHIGLPLTLLRLTGKEDFAIVEMGMSNLGEIDLLAKIAEPDIGVVTNVAEAHLKQLGSLENIAKAKRELIDNLSETGTAVLNYDNQYTRKMGENHTAEVIYYGFKAGADLRTVNYIYDKEKEILKFNIIYKNNKYSFEFYKAGKHNIYNAMAALVIGIENGIPVSKIQEGLLNAKFSSLRMEFIELKNGAKLINDSYNANPLAVRAALDTLAARKAERKIAVLGSMLELGNQSNKKHQEVGEYAAAKSLDLLITIGKKAAEIAVGAEQEMASTKIISLANNKETSDFLSAEIKSGDLILIKGSRANKLEEIVAELKIKEF